MKQYHRCLEQEVKRFLIKENYEEQEETKLEKELEELNWYISKERYEDLISLDDIKDYLSWPRKAGCEFDDEGYLLDYDDWEDDEIFDCVDNDSEEIFGHDDYEDYDYYPMPSFEAKRNVAKIERVLEEMQNEHWGDDDLDYSQEDKEEEDPFPKYLEYKFNEYGYPSRIHCEEEFEDDLFYQGIEPREKLGREQENRLIEMLRIRHNLPNNKKIYF
jgi:hypothetical protein